jgi:5-methyltetrahydrofolate--homocysteine methyltransferase
MLEPLGDLAYSDAFAAFSEQAAALAGGGADLIWIETMSDLQEAKAAIEATRSICELPIAATLTFDTHGRTMMGVSPQEAVQDLHGYDLIAFGANCGNGPAEIEGVITSMHDSDPGRPLIAKSNAGIPVEREGETVYDGTPEIMSEHALRVRSLGASLIGACCGSTPAHLQAMAEALAEGK